MQSDDIQTKDIAPKYLALILLLIQSAKSGNLKLSNFADGATLGIIEEKPSRSLKMPYISVSSRFVGVIQTDLCVYSRNS